MTEQERAERGWPSVARVAYQRGPFFGAAEVPRQRCAQPAAPVYQRRIGVPLDEMAQLARGNDAEDEPARQPHWPNNDHEQDGA